MYCLIEERLWQANAVEAGDVRAVLNLGVQAVVDLAVEEEPARYPRDILVLRYPIFDGEGNPRWMLELIVSSINDLLVNEIPTIVYCSAGLSRSPCLCAAALARYRGLSMEEAIASVTGGRLLDVAPGLLNDLVRLQS